jgi:hypothetical protein
MEGFVVSSFPNLLNCCRALVFSAESGSDCSCSVTLLVESRAVNGGFVYEDCDPDC